MTSFSKLEQLYRDLDKAIVLSWEYSGGYSNNFLSAEEFNKALIDTVSKLKKGDCRQISELYFWFAPTCDWDNFIGVNGVALGNEIFELLSDIKSPDKTR